MKYNEINLRNALRMINPESYHAYADLAGLNLPQILDRMFVVGFVMNMRGEIDMSEENKELLIRAYNQLSGSPGYFAFEE